MVEWKSARFSVYKYIHKCMYWKVYTYIRGILIISSPHSFLLVPPNFSPSYLLPNFMSSFYNYYLSFIYLTAESSYCCPYVNMFGIINWRMRGRPTSGHTHEKEVPMSQQPSCKKIKRDARRDKKKTWVARWKSGKHHKIGWRLIWMG